MCYSDDVKIRLLNVSEQVLAEKTAVCEEVAVEMVKGACETLGCDYAIASTGIAGPGGGTPEIPVGTIWIAYGEPDDIRTIKLTEDNGRDRNLAAAASTALRLFLEYIKEKNGLENEE